MTSSGYSLLVLIPEVPDRRPRGHRARASHAQAGGGARTVSRGGVSESAARRSRVRPQMPRRFSGKSGHPNLRQWRGQRRGRRARGASRGSRGKGRAGLFHRLPDGAGTNRVVAEVQRFPMIHVHGKTCCNTWNIHAAKCGNIWALKTNYLLHHVGYLWSFCENIRVSIESLFLLSSR